MPDPVRVLGGGCASLGPSPGVTRVGRGRWTPGSGGSGSAGVVVAGAVVTGAVVTGAAVTGGAIVVEGGARSASVGAARVAAGSEVVVLLGPEARPTTNAAAMTSAVTTAATAVGITHAGRGVGGAALAGGAAVCTADCFTPPAALIVTAELATSFIVWSEAT